eukprot:6383631-Amphidinium_carterae.2
MDGTGWYGLWALPILGLIYKLAASALEAVRWKFLSGDSCKALHNSTTAATANITSSSLWGCHNHCG